MCHKKQRKEEGPVGMKGKWYLKGKILTTAVGRHGAIRRYLEHYQPLIDFKLMIEDLLEREVHLEITSLAGRAQNRGRAARYSAMAEQASLLRQQDETLATLGQGVQRVKALAGVMNEELSEQAVILDSLDDDVNKTDSAMHTMNRKLKTLVADAKKSDRAQWALIGCLILTLVVLTTMVLSDD